jgi:hypothetical protein
MDERFNAALRLHGYLVAHHWKHDGLIGPDPGIRFNYRLFRFAKSYLRAIQWHDDLYYLQGQGYWTLANWRLFTLTGEQQYRDIAVRCSDTMIEHQRADGGWEYPNPEWRGRIATAEGAWAAIGLVETYRQTREQRFMDSLLKWYKFMTETIGFQEVGDQLAVNYFAHEPGARVPNNTAFVLRLMAEMYDATGDEHYLERCPALLKFMQFAQKVTGEFPYAVEGPNGGTYEAHFQCYQYNAFQCLDLMRYYEITHDGLALPMIRRLLDFLKSGVGEDGHAYYDCDSPNRTVTYHTAVMAAAFGEAARLGLSPYGELANRAYQYVLDLQRPDGSFPHSRGDYHILSDQRSYPRYLAMITYHLLQAQQTENDEARKEQARDGVR